MRKLRADNLTVALFLFILVPLLLWPGEPPPSVVWGRAGAPTFTFALVGDVMLGRGVHRDLAGDWNAAFARVRPWLSEPAVAFANLESPLTDAPQVDDDYDLRAPPEAVLALVHAGFDVVSLTNNHALDADEAGLAQTAAALNAAGIVGLDGPTCQYPRTLRRFSYRNKYQARIQAPLRVSWEPVGIPAYCFIAFEDSVVPLDISAAREAVAAAAGQASVVVVSVHWGGEYQAKPSVRQRAIADALAKAGADVIVGHGPHVLQRIEWVGETLVAYSLGNFLFDQPYPVDCRWGAILSVTSQGGRVVAFEAIPTVTERGRVRLARPEERTAILARLNLGP